MRYLANAPRGSRFFGISGMYFSLQYLSLSEATVLTFIVPIFTGFTGAIFLKEPLSFRELLAACTYLPARCDFIYQRTVFSFIGVLLIARPQFLFGSSQGFLDSSESTPAQRILSIMSEEFHLILGYSTHLWDSASLTSYSSQCVLACTLGCALLKFYKGPTNDVFQDNFV